MQNGASGRPFVVSLLIWLQILLGLQALGGGGAFLLAPDGHLIQMPLSNLKNSPFTDFLIPGLLLFVFLGIYPVVIGFGLWNRPAWRLLNALNPFKRFHWSWAGSLAAGAIAMIWIVVQIQMVQLSFLHIFIFAWGAVLVLLTLLPKVRQYYQLKT